MIVDARVLKKDFLELKVMPRQGNGLNIKFCSPTQPIATTLKRVVSSLS